MNIKIYNKLQEMVKQSPVMLTNPQSLKAVVSAVFGVEVPNKIEGGIIELTYIIDALIMENYFAKVWQPKTKAYKYSGLSIIDEVNALQPERVLDIGCGYNEFKGKINNLIGVDPYNDKADVKSDITSFALQADTPPDELFDVVISLGSINFGSADKILLELNHVINLTAPGGLLFFRVNPGKMHEAEAAKCIHFFEWTPEFITNMANVFECILVTIKQDNGRLFFILKKRN